MAGKFEIKKSNNDQFFFNLRSGNGQVILTSQMYAAKSSAEGGIESARKNAPIDSRYERKTSTGGQPYFVLKAANSETIGVLQMRSNAVRRDHRRGCLAFLREVKRIEWKT